MPRNLDRRVEIVFPVEDDVIKDRIKHILDVLLRDNLKAYAMLSDGTYAKMSRRGKQAIGAQMTFCREQWKERRRRPQFGKADALYRSGPLMKKNMKPKILLLDLNCTKLSEKHNI